MTRARLTPAISGAMHCSIRLAFAIAICLAHHLTLAQSRPASCRLIHRMPAPALFLPAVFTLLPSGLAGHAAELELRAKVGEANGVNIVEHWSGPMLVGRSTEAAPAGVELRLPGASGRDGSRASSWRVKSPRGDGDRKHRCGEARSVTEGPWNEHEPA